MYLIGTHLSRLICVSFVYTFRFMKKEADKGKKRRKPKADRKESVIPVRCTAEQKRTLEERAKARGMGVSTWLLNLGLSASDRP